MNRRSGARLTIATGLAVGLSIGVAPQWASGSPAVGTGDLSPIAAVGAHVWADVADLVSVVPSEPRSATPDTEALGVEVLVPPTDVTASAATPEPAAIPAPAPAPAEAAAPASAPVQAPAVVTSTATIHVDVVVVGGATRYVSLRGADGTVVAGPVTVDGARISFSDLDDGAYGLFAEQFHDDGGTFLTRATIQVAGEETVVRCDDETLDCTVSS